MTDESNDPYLAAMLEGRAEAAPVEDEAADTPEEAPDAEPAAADEADQTQEDPEKPRNERGQFAKKDDETAADAAAELILGKFKSQDDLVKAYQEAEKHLGQLRNDNSQYRQQVEQMAALQRQIEELRAQAGQPVRQYDFAALIEENPGYAAQLAYEQNDQMAFTQAWQAWAEEQPAQAAVWLANVQIDQRVSEIDKRFQQATEPLTEERSQQQMQRAWSTVSNKFPDAKDLASDIYEAAQEAPELLSALQSGTQDAAERVFTNLYWLVRGRRADQLAVATEQITAEQAEQNEANRRNAVVASASSAKALGGEGKRKDPAALMRDMYTAPDESHLPYWERSDYKP